MQGWPTGWTKSPYSLIWHWPAGDYKQGHKDRKRKQVLCKKSGQSLKQVSQRGCEISILGDTRNSNWIKYWATWSNFEISLVLGKEWGYLDQMASRCPLCLKLTYDHHTPNLQLSGAGGASWTTWTDLYLEALHVFILFYELVRGLFWTTVNFCYPQYFGAKCSPASLCYS